MEPRLVLVLPLLMVLATVVLSVYGQQSTVVQPVEDRAVSRVVVPRGSPAAPAVTATSTATLRAGHSPGDACEARIGAWYGNSTHICWYAVCSPVTPEHRHVFLQVAGLLRAMVDVVRGINESLAGGCLIMPGFAEKVLEAAARVEKLAERRVTGCTLTEMIAIIEGLRKYMDNMAPVWGKLSRECAEKKLQDTEWVDEALHKIKSSLREAVAEIETVVKEARKGAEDLVSLLKQYYRDVREDVYKLNKTTSRGLEVLDDWLEGFLDRKALTEDLRSLINISGIKVVKTKGLENLQDELEELREKLSELNNKLRLNTTLPGKR